MDNLRCVSSVIFFIVLLEEHSVAPLVTSCHHVQDVGEREKGRQDETHDLEGQVQSSGLLLANLGTQTTVTWISCEDGNDHSNNSVDPIHNPHEVDDFDQIDLDQSSCEQESPLDPLDDMIDSGGTLAHAANLMMERGAISVRAICTHPILSGDAYNKIQESGLTELIVSDTIPLKKETSKIKVVSCAPLFADVMHKVQDNTSISGQFLM